MWEIFDEVKEMVGSGNLPGLIKGSNLFFVLVDIPDHEHNHPKLVVTKDVVKEFLEYQVPKSLQIS